MPSSSAKSASSSAKSASSSAKSSSPKNKKEEPVLMTNTNTDSHCLPKEHWRFQHWLYLARLYNGFYMLNAKEQTICHVTGWIVAVLAVLYAYVFLRGFMDGFAQNNSNVLLLES